MRIPTKLNHIINHNFFDFLLSLISFRLCFFAFLLFLNLIVSWVVSVSLGSQILKVHTSKSCVPIKCIADLLLVQDSFCQIWIAYVTSSEADHVGKSSSNFLDSSHLSKLIISNYQPFEMRSQKFANVWNLFLR